MAQQVTNLEIILQAMIEEHGRMLAAVAQQHEAVKKLSMEQLTESTNRLEASRVRLSQMETRRKQAVIIIAKLVNGTPQMTVTQIAAAFPQHAPRLTQLGQQLKKAINDIQQHTTVIGKVSVAVLGHLNGALRAFARAVGQAGTYTKGGIPKVASRIGIMDAVG